MNFLGPLPQAHPDYLAGLIAAVLLGAFIGLERQWRGHPAGLHTNALVALGSAAYVIVGVLSVTLRDRRVSWDRSSRASAFCARGS